LKSRREQQDADMTPEMQNAIFGRDAVRLF